MKLKDLKEYKVREIKQASYIPILDKDPIYAAEAIVTKDLKKTYTLLKEVFEDIKRDKYYYEPLQDTILFSFENFMWFASFLKRIEKALGEEEYRIPYEKAPSIHYERGVVVFQPFHSYKRKNENKDIMLCFWQANVKGQPPINNYRIRYIMESYEMSDFQNDAFPVWYLLQNVTVFEQYSEKTNTRVRVDFRSGKFLYFIAGASDNWQQIEDVPKEMDHVIAALIFRRD